MSTISLDFLQTKNTLADVINKILILQTQWCKVEIWLRGIGVHRKVEVSS